MSKNVWSTSWVKMRVCFCFLRRPQIGIHWILSHIWIWLQPQNVLWCFYGKYTGLIIFNHYIDAWRDLKRWERFSQNNLNVSLFLIQSFKSHEIECTGKMDYLYDTMVLQQHQQNILLQVFWEAIQINVERIIRTESFRDSMSNRLQSCECMFYKHTWALTSNKCITISLW